MGGLLSRDVAPAPYLQRLVGREPLAYDNPLWRELVVSPLGVEGTGGRTATGADGAVRTLDELVRAVCDQLVVNNPATRNFNQLVLHLITQLKASILCEETEFPLSTLNLTFLVRLFAQHFLERLPSDHLAHVWNFQDPPLPRPESDALLEAMSAFLLECPVGPNTYLLHAEILSLLLVLCSTQLFQAPGRERSNFFLDKLCDLPLRQAELTRRLVLHVVEQQPCPPNGPHQSFLGSIGSAASTLLHPWQLYNLFFPSHTAGRPLAKRSLTLLIILAHYNPSDPSARNPFRATLRTLTDSRFDVTEEHHIPVGVQRVSFPSLYDALARTLPDNQAALLLYLLLHGNPLFLEYVLARTDLETLIIPILYSLYWATRLKSNQIYMLLVILLILTQDSSFNTHVHAIIIPYIPWYKERVLHNVSLGSVMVIVLIRMVRFNLSRLRDVYLHTNCLAALANMAPSFRDLDDYAAQRLMELFSMLAKKYLVLRGVRIPGSPPLSPSSTADMTTIIWNDTEKEMTTELATYQDFLRIVLDIINACLTHALPKNPNIVYAILRERRLFEPFRTHPRFWDLIDNLDKIMNHFGGCLTAGRKKVQQEEDWTVQRTQAVLAEATRSWRGNDLHVFPDLRFTYEEEANAEDFFIPYVWSLAIEDDVGIRWDTSRMVLVPSGEAKSTTSRASSETGAEDEELEGSSADTERDMLFRESGI